MKTVYKTFYILAVLVLINSCGGGGGGGSASIPEGYSKVQINIGSFRASTSSVPVAFPNASTNVPADVDHLVFYDVRSISNISLLREFDVSQGFNEIFATLMQNGFHIVYVQALDSSGKIRYSGARAMILGGGWYYIPIQMVPFSEQLPQFSGLQTIDGITANSMTLHWSPATDDTTPQEQIQYLVYMSLTPGGENFVTPSFTTDPGQTSFTVTGLSPNTTYYFIVRAMDQATITDSNTVERSATTLAGAAAGGAPVFGGLISATATSTTDVALTWGQATDDDTPSQEIRYLIFLATQPGGEDFSNPWKVVKGTLSTFISGLQPDSDYCFVARAQDLGGNTDSNTVEKCVRTPLNPLPPFVVAPAAATICEDNNGCANLVVETVTVNISGGAPPYNMVSGNPAVIPNATGIAGSTYLVDATDNSVAANTPVTLTFSDSQGATANVTVTVLNEIVVVLATGSTGSICENNTPCTGAGSEFSMYVVSGGTGPYSASYFTGDGTIFTIISNPPVNDTFSVDAEDCTVPDAAGNISYTLTFQDANLTSTNASITVINQSCVIP